MLKYTQRITNPNKTNLKPKKTSKEVDNFFSSLKFF